MKARRGALALVVGACLVAAMSGCDKASVPEFDPVLRGPVEARADVDRAVATTGDVITFRVTVDHDPAYEIVLPEPGAEIAGFRIVDLGREPVEERRGRRIERMWYELRADLVGSYVLPPVSVGYRRLEGAEGEAEDGVQNHVRSEGRLEVVQTSAIFVEVESVLPKDGAASDIRGLKPLHHVRGPMPWKWVAVGLALALMAAAGAVLLNRHRRNRPVVPPPPAHEVAFEALANLRDGDFDDPLAVRRFFFSISEIVRAYVEARFELNATDLTTEEILVALPHLGALVEEQRDGLEAFLSETDQVKFADRSATPEDVESTYEGALRFVEQTRPLQVEEEAA